MEFGKGRLKGIEVNIYQGNNGSWHASVLLDKNVWGRGDAWYEPVHLPRIGNRPTTDSGSGRWWYDLTSGLNVYRGKHHPNFGMRGPKRDPQEALANLVLDVTLLVTDILATRKEPKPSDLFKVGLAVTKIRAIPSKHYKG